MKARYFFIPPVVLGAALMTGQIPPPPTGFPGSPRSGIHHRLPADQPAEQKEQVIRRRVDQAQVKREADELAKLADELLPAVDQAGKGVISKDLNDRLKRVEKLAKQLRRDLFP